jgi:mannitol/fructose-specific phosphotransferase system IIA component (Ntr-type)
MRSILNALQEGRLFELPDVGGKPRALGFLARILDANPDIEVGTDTIEEINKREEACNTGIGLGVGVPHVRAGREEGELFCAIGWSAQGLEYGAQDGKAVHLVVMYYIPGAQKNVYLKEVSSLVKAIRKTGGIEPIAHATELNDVRNLLLDWVSAGLGEAGPESVARMIKLEVKQAQVASPAAPVPAPAAPPELVLPAGRAPKVTVLSILAAHPGGLFVLAADPEWVAAVEREPHLAERLSAAVPFTAGGRQIFVTSARPFPGGRMLYECVALGGAS